MWLYIIKIDIMYCLQLPGIKTFDILGEKSIWYAV